MLKLLTVNNLGQAGYNSDIAKMDLGPEYLTYAENFRIDRASLETFGGTIVSIDPPDDGDSIGLLYAIRTTTENAWFILGQHSIYQFDGNLWVNVSPENEDGDPIDLNLSAGREVLWTGCVIGKTVFFNHPDIGPLYATIGSDVGSFQDLPFTFGDPAQGIPPATFREVGIFFEVMRSHKNFLFGFALTEGGNFFGDSYRWSHPADENGIPFTWDESDLSSLAGRASLGGDGGQIIDGLSMRDSLFIYSQDSIDFLAFTGGDFVWQRNRLSSIVGLLSKDCVVEVKGVHYLMVDGDIVKNDGTNITSIIHNRIQKEFNSSANAESLTTSFSLRNDSKKEIWFCIPEGESTFPTKAYVYNWRDDTWYLKDFSPAIVSGASGVRPVDKDTWEEMSSTWENETRQWASGRATSINDTLIGVYSDGTLIEIDPTGNIDEDGFNTVLERTDYPLEGNRVNNTVVRVYPHISSSGNVLIQVGSQQFPGDSVNWEDAQTFDPNTQRKLDVRTTGELFCWRVTSIEQSRFRLSGMDFEYANAGVR